MAAPTESKVFGGSIGGGSGAVVTTFVLWLLGVFVWDAPSTSDASAFAVAAVPGPVSAFIGLLLIVGGAFLGGWLAKHTPRPEEVLPRRALVENEDDGAGTESPTVDAEPRELVPDDLLVPEYSTVV
jgi:hypothetical protein